MDVMSEPAPSASWLDPPAAPSAGDERFRLLADAAPVLVWVAGLDGRCNHFNRGWLEFRGRTMEEERGDGWAEGVHPADLESCVSGYRAAFARRVPFELRYRLRRADGVFRWILDRGVPVFGEGGAFEGYVGACIDVTEIEETRAHLTRQRALALDLAAAPSLEAAADRILESLLALDGVRGGVLCRQEAGSGRLRCFRQMGLTLDLSGCTCPIRSGSGEPEWTDDPAGLRSPCHASPEGYRCDMRVPILLEGAELASVSVFAVRTVLPASSRDAALALVAQVGAALQRVEAQDALRRSEHRYRALVAQCPEGIFLYDPETGCLQQVNRMACQLLGYSEREMLGMRLEEFVVGHDGLVGAAVETSAERLGSAVYRRRDGTLLDVELTAAPVQYRASSLVQVYFRDVTDRNRSRAALDRVTRRNEMILESAGEGILGIDHEGYHTFVNPAAARLLGWAAEELIGKKTHGTWHHSRRDGTPYPESECPVYAALRDGVTRRVRSEAFWRRDGSSFAVEYVSTPIRNGPQPAGAVVVFRDVSREERLESIAEAVETMNSLGYVFSTVRHELGNPINSVKMALSVLRQSVRRLPAESVESYLDRSLSELGRVEDLLSSLKSFSLYEDVQVRVVDLADLVSGFAALVRPDFERRGVDLALGPSGSGCAAWVDPRALKQVLLNLLANSADALEGRPGARITLSTFSDEGLAGVVVADNGPGLPEEVRSHMFKPFITTKPEGTGLGLVIAKKMVTRMEGTIEIDTGESVGTRVTLTFRSETSEASGTYRAPSRPGIANPRGDRENAR